MIVVSLTEIIDGSRHTDGVGVEQKGCCIFGHVICIDERFVECILQISEQIMDWINLIFPASTNQHEHSLRSGIFDDCLKTWQWRMRCHLKVEVFDASSFESCC